MNDLNNIIVFDKDDTPFFNWMNAHPNGFVLNTERRKNSRYAVIHQSNCFHISGYTSAYTSNPFTAGPYIKICADSVEALEIWLQLNRPNANKPPQYCKTCEPSPPTGKTKFTGYWTFFCNPAKWQIDQFLETNIEDDIYQVTNWQKKFFQPGQLGVIRVGIDHRTKKELGDRCELQPGIYAIVEVRSRHKKRKNAPDDYWLTYSEKDEEKPIVNIHFLKNLLNNPILIADLKSDPAIDDPYLIPGFQATTMPLTPQSFHRILQLSGSTNQVLAGVAQEINTSKTSQELERLCDQYASAVPEVRKIIANRIERGSIANRIKQHNDYKCQICEALGKSPHTFKKPNNQYYVEAHHVTPVSTGEAGVLSPSNLITVCANHHRQLHYGNAQLISETPTSFTFTIDGKHIKVSKIEIKALRPD